MVLPSDGGTGAQPSSWASGVFDGVRDAAHAAADVATELSSFTQFQKRIDDLIRDLKGSDAAPGKVGQERLVRHQFGGGDKTWAEAAGLFSAYQTVIGELETLSKLLSDSMEGMGIAVMASHKGYQNIDLDVRERMAAISAETTEHYGGSCNPSSKRHDGNEKKPKGADAGGSI
ncbi:hypothetical protein [Streptomyces sp. YIM S03343]